MIMKHFAKKQVATLLIALFALAACHNSMDLQENVSGGNVVISVGDGEGSTARTLWPADTDLSKLAYQLAFSGSGDASHAAETLNFGTPKTVSLTPGNWTITAQAKTGDTVKAEGSWTGEVSAGHTTNVSITLLPKTGSGNGTLAYTVSFPELGVGGSKSLALYAVSESGETAAGSPITNFTSGTPRTVNLPAGFYRLSLSLTNYAGKTAARTDAVHIYAGLSTAAAFSFAEEDFRILVTLNAGPAVQAEAATTTADVTFTGATGLTLSAADFAVDNGASITNVQVVSDTATVSVGFADNTGVTSKTYTVSIVGGSTKIKGSATVAITQAAAVTINAFNLSTVVTAPVRNAAPDTEPINAPQYTGTIVWYTSSGSAHSGNFAAATVYKAMVTLSAKSGYTFTGVSANNFIHMGANTVVNGANSGTVTITFLATADAVVNALDLTSVVITPVKNAAPDAMPINETQYTGSIAWYTGDGSAFNGPTFAAVTVYKALVTLNAKPGYTFTGVLANSFTYTGATATNAANSGTVTITFPATVAAVVNALDLTRLVTTPVKDAEPETPPINEPQYTGTIAWQTSSGEAFNGDTFAAATVYRALVTLSAESDYTFEGVTANSFTYTGATVTNTANSDMVTITFPATANETGTITVEFDGLPRDEIIGLVSAVTLSWVANTHMAVTVGDTFSAYAWYVDGVLLPGVTGNSVTLIAQEYFLGGHIVSVRVNTAGGGSYSKTAHFNIVQ
jgi:hypothetical protein